MTQPSRALIRWLMSLRWGWMRALGLSWFMAVSAQAQMLMQDGLVNPPALACPELPAAGNQAPRQAKTSRESSSRVEPNEDAGSPVESVNLSTVVPTLDLKSKKLWRLALWGDSHTAAGFLSEGLIQGLGLNPEDVQPSFLPASFGMAGVRLPVRRACVGPGWTRTHAYRAKTRTDYFPISLTYAGTQQNDSYVWLDFRTQRHPHGLVSVDLVMAPPDSPHSTSSVLAVSVNEAQEKIVVIDRATQPSLQFGSVNGVMTVKVRLISGDLILAGMVPRYPSKPRLIVDTYGIPGATARGWEMLEPARLQARMLAEPYDVVMLAFGTNEGNDPRYDPAKYTEGLRTALRNLRTAYPQAACVVIGPTDRGDPKRVSMASTGPGYYARVHRSITVAQRLVADEHKCQFWDWQFHMGGPGGAHQWARQKPPLMAADLIHLTLQGYRYSGQLLGKQLSVR